MSKPTRHFAQSLKNKENECHFIRCVSKETGESAKIPEKVMFKKDLLGNNVYLCSRGKFEFTKTHKNYEIFSKYKEDNDYFFSEKNIDIWSKKNIDRITSHSTVQSLIIEMMSSDLDEGELQPVNSIFDHYCKDGFKIETKAGGGKG